MCVLLVYGRNKAAPKRVNPWADPNWKPPSVAPVVEKNEAAKPTSQPVHPPSNLLNAQAQHGASQSVPGQSVITSSVVDQSKIDLLLDMGFDKARSVIALSYANDNVEDAAEWLLNPENESVLAPASKQPASLQSVAPKPVPMEIEPEKPKWVAGQRGAPLGWKAGDNFDDEPAPATIKISKNLLAKAEPKSIPSVSSGKAPLVNQVNDEASIQSQFDAQFGAQELTKEEKLAKLEEIRANYRKQREEAEKKLAQEREIARIESERKNVDLRRAMEDREMKMAIDSKKREDQLAKERHKKILAKIAEDKEKRAKEKAAAEALKAAQKANEIK